MRRLLLVAGALFLCAKSYSLTLAQAETEVRRLIRDTAVSVSLQKYSDSLIDDFLNQSQREVVNATWCLEATTSQSLASGTTFYALPSTLINVKSVRFVDSAGKIRNLEEKSVRVLDQTNPDWARQTGPPMQYILRRSTSVATDFQIAFIPNPTSASLGTGIIDYYKQATAMTSDSDVLLDGTTILLPYHETVVDETVAKIKSIEGDTAGSAYYLQLYQNSIQVMNSRLGERPNYAPGFSGASPGSSGSPGK